MTTPEIRLIPPDERLEIIPPMTGYAFTENPPLPSADDKELQAFYNSRKDDDFYALYADDKPVASLMNGRGAHNLRGQMTEVGMVWGVSVYPEVRRRGYARALVQRMFVDMRESGTAISTLYPFRESFYERLGYVSYPSAYKITVDAAALVPIQQWHLPGEVTRHLSTEDGLVDEFYDFMQRFHATQHGMTLPARSTYDWIFKDYERWMAFARVDGEIVGVMNYGVKPYLGPMDVGRMLWTTMAGRALMLEWIARHVDHVGEVTIHQVPPDTNPRTWLADTQIKVKLESAPMARLVDILGLNGMPAGPGQVTIALQDPYLPAHEGTYSLKSTDGTLEVEKTTDIVECTLSVQALTALVYGIRDPAEFALRGWGDPTPDVQATLQQMFPATQPYMFAKF